MHPELARVFSIGIAFAILGTVWAALSMILWKTYLPVILYVLWGGVGATLTRYDKIEVKMPKDDHLSITGGFYTVIQWLLWPVLLIRKQKR